MNKVVVEILADPCRWAGLGVMFQGLLPAVPPGWQPYLNGATVIAGGVATLLRWKG